MCSVDGTAVSIWYAAIDLESAYTEPAAKTSHAQSQSKLAHLHASCILKNHNFHFKCRVLSEL